MGTAVSAITTALVPPVHPGLEAWTHGGYLGLMLYLFSARSNARLEAPLIRRRLFDVVYHQLGPILFSEVYFQPEMIDGVSKYMVLVR
jgi:hypothetical protein